MCRVLYPISIACLCLIAQDYRPLREDARDRINLDGIKEAIGTEDPSSQNYLAKYQPLRFLQTCLERYEREVEGYSCTFRKVERVQGKLREPEKIEVHFRERPFSVYFNWLGGADQAQKVLYVRGENNNKLVALPRGKLAVFLAGLVERDVDSPDAKRTGRYTIDQFGIYLGAKRTLDNMKRAEERGTLHVQYKGLVDVPQLGDRKCHVFVRKPYDPPEEEGVNELTIFIDQENGLQTGSVLKDVTGELIAEYFFADVKLNQRYQENQFQKSILK